jgi:Acyclic terpene utilisation family protein AtuA
MIRIGNGQGFWGDWLEAPVRLVEQGPLDYLILDYLAEVTMSILQKQKLADAGRGYASDFPPLIGRIAGRIRERKIRVVANAGGVNPVACARAVLAAVHGSNPGLKVAVVLGDDLFARIDDLLAKGHEMRNMDTGEPLSKIRDRILSANAYIGAFPMAEALATGADVVIAGRSTDTALALAPMVHEFGWGPLDYDKLAAGTIAGHILECGAQVTGGNCQADWRSIPDLANVGYPIVDAEPDGTFVITKHKGTGGRINPHSVKEQLLYELGDPKRYLTPDCVADFTTIQLSEAGENRVRVSGIRGGERPPTIKLSISFADGWKAIGTLVYTWPEALEKARAADAIVRERLRGLGLEFDEIHTEFFGVNACLGPVAPVIDDPAEVQLRIGVRGPDKKAVDRFTRELIPLVLSGPPGATGYGEGRPPVREIVAYWPALLPREEISTRVEVVE